jgi:hypothetical protein
MRLPLKFRPRLSQLIMEVAGAAVMTGIGGYYLYNFAPPAELHQYPNFFAWVKSAPLKLPFLLMATVFFLSALAWLTVALINLLGGSPFNYIVVDRQGISYRNFWGDKRFSWKDLGPIRPLQFSVWRARGQQLRFWITADTLGAEEARRSFDWWRWGGSSGVNLRIPAATYLSGGWLVGSLALATDSAAGWLEELRQAAKIDRLEAEISDPPYNFRSPIELEPGADPSALDNAPFEAARGGLPEPGSRSFGARRPPSAEGVVER